MNQKTIPDLAGEKSFCCGCGACSSICPTGAIAMKADEKGFLYPVIEETVCIRCQRCLNVCAFKGDLLQK